MLQAQVQAGYAAAQDLFQQKKHHAALLGQRDALDLICLQRSDFGRL